MDPSAPSRSAVPADDLVDFRRFLSARVLATVSMEMISVGVAWNVYSITGRALDLGLVGLAQFLPVFGLSLLAGWTADRFSRKRIIQLCYLVFALAALLLLLLDWLGIHRIGLVYALLVLIGTARAFIGPANQSLLPSLVPLEKFPTAVAWMASAFKIANIAGPALGGLTYSVRGASVTYGVSAVGFVSALVLLHSLDPRHRPRDHEPISAKSVLAGLRFVFSKPILIGTISLDLFAVLLGGATALLPIFARDILRTGPWGLGLLRAAPAAGSAIVALALARWPLTRRAGIFMLGGVAVFGLATLGFALATEFWVALVALAISGAADMVSVYVRLSAIQLATPDPMRGRVSAVNLLFIGASNELGDFESGLVAEWLGPVRAVLVGGLGTLVVVVLWSIRFPVLRKLDRLGDVGKETM